MTDSSTSVRNVLLLPNAGDPERATDSHNANKGGWYEPKRSSTKLPREDTDHQHCENVIEAGNRMPKPMCKAGRVADPGMGKGNRRRKHNQCRGQRSSLSRD